jgi:glucosylceramidase
LTVLADSTAEPYVTGVGFHCYAGSIDAHDSIHESYPGKQVWVTECGDGDWETDPFGGKMWLLIETMRRWGSGVLLWNVAMKIAGGPGKCEDCRGVLSVESGTGVWLRNVQYNALGHFSRFVRPGAVRIGDRGGPGDVMRVAFRNPDGTPVRVVWNRQAQDVALKVTWSGRYVESSVVAGAAATLRW